MSPACWLFSDAPYPGGAERYLAWHLRAAGPARLGLIAVDRPTLRPWIDACESEGFAVRRLPLEGSRRAQALALWRLLRTMKPALLHANLPGPYDGMLGAVPAIAKGAGVTRVVVTEHLPTVGRVGKRYWVKRACVGAIDRAITVCQAHLAAMRDAFGYSAHQLVAIANGIPDPNPAGRIAAEMRSLLPADLAARERAPGMRVVQVGALDPRKGGDVLIEAVAICERAGVALNVWLVGEGPARDSWAQQIESLALADRVFLAGQRRDVAALWAAADVAVLASHREGMPLSLLEAMAHGLPVVATTVDGVPEIVEHETTGLLVPPGDARLLAWALRELAANPTRRALWGRRARANYLARHTPARMTDATFREYGAAFAGAHLPHSADLGTSDPSTVLESHA